MALELCIKSITRTNEFVRWNMNIFSHKYFYFKKSVRKRVKTETSMLLCKNQSLIIQNNVLIDHVQDVSYVIVDCSFIKKRKRLRGESWLLRKKANESTPRWMTIRDVSSLFALFKSVSIDIYLSSAVVAVAATHGYSYACIEIISEDFLHLC